MCTCAVSMLVCTVHTLLTFIQLLHRGVYCQTITVCVCNRELKKIHSQQNLSKEEQQ